MIDIKTLKELVRLMVDNDLAEIDLRDENETVTLKRASAAPPTIAVAPTHQHQHAASPAPQPAASASTPADKPADDFDGLIAIESPMVGTYYSAPDPDSPPFISNGKRIGKEDVVCLIEAMKVFNEIKAEVSGTVEKILVENGQAVEYGQKLFMVRPG